MAVSTANAAAVFGADYIISSGTLTWAGGDAADKTFTVAILDDNVYEGNETMVLILSNAAGGATLGLGTATINIVENDPLPPIH